MDQTTKQKDSKIPTGAVKLMLLVAVMGMIAVFAEAAETNTSDTSSNVSKTFQSETENLKFKKLISLTKKYIADSMTDIGLEWHVRDQDVQEEASRLFDDPTVTESLKVFNETEPLKLSSLIPQIIAVSTKNMTGDNPNIVYRTWAAGELVSHMEDIRLIELARRSVAVKLLIQEKVIAVPASRVVHFKWSGKPDIEIDLPPILWSENDKPELEKLLKSPYEFYRTASVKALKILEEQNKIKNDVAQLLRDIQSNKFEDRYKALYLLNVRNNLPQECVPYLVKIFGENSWWMNQLAEQALIKMGQPTIRTLMVGLSDKNKFVRKSSAEILDKLKWKAQTQQENIAYLIAEQRWSELTKIGEPAVSELIKCMRDKDQDIWWGAFRPLVDIGRPSVPSLIRVSNDKDAQFRKLTFRALAEIADERAKESFIRGLSDDDEYVAGWAAYGLEELRWKPRTLQENIEYLLARGIGKVGGQKYEEALIKIGQPVVSPLIEKLQDGRSFIRRKAAYILGNMGASASSALPILKQLMEIDDSVAVRYQAKEAVEKIQKAQEQEKKAPQT